MQLYGKRFLRKSIDKQIYKRQETRDAIIWSVDEDNGFAYVRVQGSDESIKAYWAKNFFNKPNWIRKGNAVRISFPRGNKRRIEIFSDGRTIPTPVGTGPILPSPDAVDDVVINGLKVTQYSGMVVQVSSGTYRINNELLVSLGMPLGNTSFNYMGDHPTIPMGSVANLITISAAPASPNYRIDVIYIDEDGVMDVSEGTPATAPIQPSIPNDTVALAAVIVPYGTTEITNSLIGAAWSDREINNLTTTWTDTDLDWGASPPYPSSTATITVYDQYGNPLVGYYSFKVEFDSGNGTLQHGTDDPSTSSIIFSVSNASTAQFTYTRNNDSGDISPNIKVTLLTNSVFYTLNIILLRDLSGAVMI